MIDAELARIGPAFAAGSGQEMLTGMVDVMDAQDAGSGWTSGCGRPHPLGGYHHREVRTGRDHFEVLCLDENADRHRDDGRPAMLSISTETGLLSAIWSANGHRHRADGPTTIRGPASRSAAVAPGWTSTSMAWRSGPATSRTACLPRSAT